MTWRASGAIASAPAGWASGARWRTHTPPPPPAPGGGARARRVPAASPRARAPGQGVTTLEGKLVELPIVERARRVLALAARRV